MRWYVIPDIEIPPEIVGQTVTLRMWDHGSGHSGEKWDCGECQQAQERLVVPPRRAVTGSCCRVATGPLPSLSSHLLKFSSCFDGPAAALVPIELLDLTDGKAKGAVTILGRTPEEDEAGTNQGQGDDDWM